MVSQTIIKNKSINKCKILDKCHIYKGLRKLVYFVTVPDLDIEVMNDIIIILTCIAYLGARTIQNIYVLFNPY